jgi:adenylylsulfate kinase
MIKKILIMGLPKSGKTTLAKELCPLLQAVHFDADDIRKNINLDLGFSEHDRIEQARRMGWLCDRVVEAGQFAVASFICPTIATRRAFGNCYVIWMNTIEKSQYSDTNQIFEKPIFPNFVEGIPRSTKTAFELACKIRNEILGITPKSLFIGRWQPLHEGHIQLISTALKEGKKVVVGIRDTPVSKDNPFTIRDREIMIQRAFGKDKVEMVVIPDIEEICIGRKVGYGIREIVLPENIQAISGTKERENMTV